MPKKCTNRKAINVKYIIMCGRSDNSMTGTTIPKQLLSVNGEQIVRRTIRLLQNCGISIDDIAVSTNDDRFNNLECRILHHENMGPWVNGFYPMSEPVCYVFGDVVFSPQAIQTIVSTPTDDIQFFASAPPFSTDYPKKWAEPFAFKVVNTPLFKQSIDKVKAGIANRVWHRHPIAWELWQVIKNTPYNTIKYDNYCVINDYTCDIDYLKDLTFYERKLKQLDSESQEPTKYLIHAIPKRMWYVEQYLVPSMIKQGIDESAISVYNDIDGEGNLMACMKAFASCEGDGGTWHLQDDVCICKDFKTRTEQYNSGLVCGFSSKMYDGESSNRLGLVPRKDMWFSFPCIRIPDEWARSCSDWAIHYIIGNPVYERYWKNGVNDDWMFRQYLKEFHANCVALNTNPNLVNHVDYLIGGGTGKNARKEPCVSQYWVDDDLIEALKTQLESR